TEGTLSADALTFTPANALTPQTVTVAGADDTLVDGSVGYTVATDATVSADPAFNGLDVADVAVVNLDNDVAGVAVTSDPQLETPEAGGPAPFTVALPATPTADVSPPLSSSDPTEGAVSPATLTFTPADALVPQTVTVTGAEDTLVDGR